MSDKKDTPPLSIYSSRDELNDERGGLRLDSPADQELRNLFQRWSAPLTPASLDSRIITSYRQQILSQENRQEIFMKHCPTCQEEFANKFSFCPVDGTPLNDAAIDLAASSSPDIPPMHLSGAYAAAGALVPVGSEYHLTFLDDTGLTRRLMDKLKVVAHNSELTWPEFKRDPFGYSGRFVKGYSSLVWRFFSSRNVAIATSAALLVVLSAAIAVIVTGRNNEAAQAKLDKDLMVEELIAPEDIPAEIEKTKPDEGIGTGKGGRVGFNKGKGEGSLPKFAKSGGGGGGGQQDTLPTQVGKIPAPSEIPSKIPTSPPLRPPQLPVAGINIDPALYKNLPYDRFGDPRSKSQATSAGTGTGNGLGNGTGAGIGEGDGQGFGPGRDKGMGGGNYQPGGGGSGGGTGNNAEAPDYNKTFNPSQVNVKARILSRPEPQYTEEARKNQVSGTVVLRAVFSSSGQVTNIRAVSGLPNGLTERAIAAARQIRFTPAMKDGHAVSQYIQIEYNFNLY
ncbi:MAG TPA: energy transducer TonB [Pyrinomonadaceae bacterium]|jgi:TonB family protein|nr:energy transducer TonB [Pyrinomonadaceae bacterium]